MSSPEKTQPGGGPIGRRALLKGVGAGAVGVLAAGVPLLARADGTPPLDDSSDDELAFSPATLAALLNPAPIQHDICMERLDNGVLHVAVRTDMHGVKGAMLAWWFLFRPNTEQYWWWNPVDHFQSHWDVSNVQPGTVYGSIHEVDESLTGQFRQFLSIQFRNPAEAGFFGFDPTTNPNVSAALCARVGPNAGPPNWSSLTMDPTGNIVGSRLVHLCRDTPWGSVLRSHVWLGQDLPGQGVPPAGIVQLFPDAYGPALMQHIYSEMTFLSHFLPQIYRAETYKSDPNKYPIRLPW